MSTEDTAREPAPGECPVCYCFDGPEEGTPLTPGVLKDSFQMAFAAGMAHGAICIFTRSGVWQKVCERHRLPIFSVLDAFCADQNAPRDEVYASFGYEVSKEPIQ